MARGIHIESQSGHLMFGLCCDDGTIEIGAKPIGTEASKNLKKQFKRDPYVVTAVVNMKGPNGTLADLRTGYFEQTNTLARANATLWSIRIAEQPVVPGHDMPPTETGGIAVEHSIDVGEQTVFDELELGQIFKYAAGYPKLTHAIKVGSSTALVNIEIHHYDGMVLMRARHDSTKDRIRKNTQVAIVCPKQTNEAAPSLPSNEVALSLTMNELKALVMMSISEIAYHESISLREAWSKPEYRPRHKTYLSSDKHLGLDEVTDILEWKFDSLL